MKNWNRWLIAALIVCMLLPGTAGFAASDVQLDEGETGLLRELGLLDKSYDPQQLITRAQLAELGVRVAGVLPDSQAKGAAVFYDMTDENPDYGVVAAAAELGLVSGSTNGYFYPNRAATVSEAVKIFACAAGYAPYAAVHGGYPTGYWAAAQMMKLTPGGTDDTLTWERAAAMVFQTLHAPAYLQTAFGESQEYAADRDRTVLLEKHHIIHEEGVVDGAPYTTLTHATEDIRDGELTIDGRKFRWETGAADLGYRVHYYYDSDQTGTPALRYIYRDSVKNASLTVQAQDLVSFSGDVLTYQREQDARVQKIRFAEHPDLLYNGIAYATYTDADVLPQSGDVTLIDYDGDGGYELIKVRSYTFFVVGAVDFENQILYEKYNRALPLQLDDMHCRATITRGDKTIRMQQLMEGQMLAVGRSKNTAGLPHVELIALTGAVSGVLDSVSPTEIGLNYQTYPLGGRLAEEYDGGLMVDTDTGAYRLSVGDAASFYPFMGQMVMAAFTGAQDWKLGYLIKAEEGKKFNAEKRFLLATGKAKVETLYGADSVRVDGKPCKEAGDLYGALLQSAALSNADSAWPVSQPVRYRLDGNGRINELDTIVQSDGDGQEDLQLDGAYLSETVSYLSANKSLYQSERELTATLTADTQVLWVPVNDREAAEHYNFTTSGTMMSNNANYNVELFNIGNNLVPRYAVVYLKINTNVSSSAAPIPVVSVSRALDETGQEITKINAYVNGKLTGLTVSSDLELPVLKEGDLIRYRANNANEIYVLTKEFSPSAPPPDRNGRIVADKGTSTGAEYVYSYRTLYGSVWARDAGMITAVDSIATDEGGVAGYSYIDNFLVSGSTYFYVYDTAKKSNRLTTCTINDLMPYTSAGENASRVLLYTKSGALNMVYLILE